MERKIKRYTAIILALVAIVIAFDFDGLFNEQSIENNENQISLVKCIDGDTANFTSIGKTRFLLIDTPESTNKVELYGKKAAKFTCDTLKKAKMITYEYDGSKKDRYDRTLAWIFVDGKLIQELLAKEGYVKKFYIYKKNYKYEAQIRNSLNDKYGLFEKEMKKK